MIHLSERFQQNCQVICDMMVPVCPIIVFSLLAGEQCVHHSTISQCFIISLSHRGSLANETAAQLILGIVLLVEIQSCFFPLSHLHVFVHNAIVSMKY